MTRYLKGAALVLLSLIFLSGCGGRDLSNVRTSLYGHWVDEHDTHHYYSDEGIIKISEEGKRTELDYKVLEHDEVKNLITLEITNLEDGSGYITEYRFTNDDRDKAQQTTPLDSFKLSTRDEDSDSDEWVEQTVRSAMNDLIASKAGEVMVSDMEYIDDKQEPQKE